MLAKLPNTSLRHAILAHPTMAEGLTVLFARRSADTIERAYYKPLEGEAAA